MYNACLSLKGVGYTNPRNTTEDMLGSAEGFRSLPHDQKAKE